MQKVNPVSMHTAVSAYLFPLLEGGGVEFSNQVHGNEFHGLWWHLEVFLLDLLDFNVVLCACAACVTVSLDSLFHTFPVVHLFERTVGPFESIVSLLVVCQYQQTVF